MIGLAHMKALDHLSFCIALCVQLTNKPVVVNFTHGHVPVVALVIMHPNHINLALRETSDFS